MTNLLKIWVGLMLLGGFMIGINGYELFKETESDQLIKEIVKSQKNNVQAISSRQVEQSDLSLSSLSDSTLQNYFLQEKNAHNHSKWITP